MSLKYSIHSLFFEVRKNSVFLRLQFQTLQLTFHFIFLGCITEGNKSCEFPFYYRATTLDSWFLYKKCSKQHNKVMNSKKWWCATEKNGKQFREFPKFGIRWPQKKIEAKRTETIEPEVGNPPNKHFNMFLCAADIFLYTEAVRQQLGSCEVAARQQLASSQQAVSKQLASNFST